MFYCRKSYATLWSCPSFKHTNMVMLVGTYWFWRCACSSRSMGVFITPLCHTKPLIRHYDGLSPGAFLELCTFDLLFFMQLQPVGAIGFPCVIKNPWELFLGKLSRIHNKNFECYGTEAYVLFNADLLTCLWNKKIWNLERNLPGKSVLFLKTT